MSVLPIPYSCAVLGDDCSPDVGWGFDSHGRRYPSKYVWCYVSQGARPFWFAGWFDENGDYHYEVWYDRYRESQGWENTFNFKPKIEKGVSCPDGIKRTGFWVISEPGTVYPFQTYQYNVKVGDMLATGFDQFQVIGLFEAWEITTLVTGFRCLLMPIGGIVPGIIPIVLPIWPIISILGGGGGIKETSDSICISALRAAVIAARRRRTRKYHELQE